MIVSCKYCGSEIYKPTCVINRSKKKGLNIFCNEYATIPKHINKKQLIIWQRDLQIQTNIRSHL